MASMCIMGRPSRYRLDYCRFGATNEQLAECFEVTSRTIDNGLAAIPGSKDACEQILFGLQQAGVVERASSEETPSRGRRPNRWWVNPTQFETAVTGNSGNSPQA